jgi:hypothetical protein
MCEICWLLLNPNHPPITVRGGDPEKCCWCGNETESGIFVRYDPTELRCGGHHEGEMDGNE